MIEHFDTSNFATEKHYSTNNSNNWSCNAYLGIGAGAHSYNGKDTRRWNISDNQHYIAGIKAKKSVFEEEIIDNTTAYNEFIMTGLRTIWGCDLTTLKARFGNDKLAYCLATISSFIAHQQIIKKDNIITIAPQAIFISDQIMSDLMIVE